MDFEEYFGEEVTPDEEVPLSGDTIKPGVKTKIVLDKEQPELINTYKLKQIQELQDTGFLQSRPEISDIDVMCEALSDVLNKIWGVDWGKFGPELTTDSTNPDEIILPQITYDYLVRKIPERFPKKPQLYTTIKEVVDGKLTGDAFKVFRQWFDYVIEFQVWGETSIQARATMKNFESVINQATAFLKHHGVSKIIFLEESNTNSTKKFKDDVPSRGIRYLVRMETIEILRVSTLQSIQFNIDVI